MGNRLRINKIVDSQYVISLVENRVLLKRKGNKNLHEIYKLKIDCFVFRNDRKIKPYPTKFQK